MHGTCRNNLLACRLELDTRVLCQRTDDSQVCGLMQVIVVATAARDYMRARIQMQADVTGEFSQAIAACRIVARIGIDDEVNWTQSNTYVQPLAFCLCQHIGRVCLGARPAC
ncbi:hypothetical protein A7X60_14655 [Stenotrophomonas maltophilia]|nr:hypothetical protein A7X60_14655 [Stenotrophomonas maltophilia]